VAGRTRRRSGRSSRCTGVPRFSTIGTTEWDDPDGHEVDRQTTEQLEQREASLLDQCVVDDGGVHDGAGRGQDLTGAQREGLDRGGNRRGRDAAAAGRSTGDNRERNLVAVVEHVHERDVEAGGSSGDPRAKVGGG
jgi:hypothetical protein